MKNIKTLAQDLKDGSPSFPRMARYADEVLAKIVKKYFPNLEE